MMMCVVKEIQNRKAACDQDKSVIDNEIVWYVCKLESNQMKNASCTLFAFS